MTDRDYMLRAIELAKGGLGWTSPNPLVGAVIVKDGRIIGEGYHERCGELHAERNAIASLTESAEGADTLCDVGAVLPLRKDTALHGGDPRAEDRKSRDWFKRSESPGSRKRSGDPKSSGSPGGRGLYAGGMRCVKSGVLPLYHK